LRVLLCDDEAGTRLIVKHLLVRKLGCEVVECTDGTEALQALGRYRFDLAIIDINMPLLDGIAVVEAVRDSPTLKDLRVVMLSADTREEVVCRLVALGVSDFIAKPLVPDTALAKLDRVKQSIAGSRRAMIARIQAHKTA